MQNNDSVIRSAIISAANEQIRQNILSKIAIANSEKLIDQNELQNNLELLTRNKLTNGSILLYDPKHARQIESQHLIENFSAACFVEYVEEYNDKGLLCGHIEIHYPDTDYGSEPFRIAVQTYINNVMTFVFNSISNA